MTALTRLFVGNLPENVSQNELRSAFSAFGEITTLDLKAKPAVEDNRKLFAFVTLSASNYDIESCIRHFTNEDFNGNRLYVTRARESFLERLQREREEAQGKELEKNEPQKTNVSPKPLNINPSSYKRKIEAIKEVNENGYEHKPKKKFDKEHTSNHVAPESKMGDTFHNKVAPSGDQNMEKNVKQQISDKKRLESMKKKRQEFNAKKNIIKTGLIGIDKAPNKKVIFSDNDEDDTSHNKSKIGVNGDNRESNKKRELFEDGDDSDNEVNFEIKKQFEGKKGQKVLDLQSRYKADKRFVLDERFIEDDKSDEEAKQAEEEPNQEEGVELGQVDEKYKQLNILQDVLGVPIKIKQTQDSTKQVKSKMGMPRFDPTQPEHAKFLAPVTEKQEQTKKSKKKKSKETPEEIVQEVKEVEKVEVSKEQFYKVSDTLKEAIAQPSSFSLRSLFGRENDVDDNDIEIPEENNENKIPKTTKEKKVRHPLDPGEKNPFKYDSSDSENEEETKFEEVDKIAQVAEPKPVWREKLFFSTSDSRLKDGLLFFTSTNADRGHKDRRELKSVMKKRVYNKERKNQMFQKKIGGRRKGAKKNFRKKS